MYWASFTVHSQLIMLRPILKFHFNLQSNQVLYSQICETIQALIQCGKPFLFQVTRWPILSFPLKSSHHFLCGEIFVHSFCLSYTFFKTVFPNLYEAKTSILWIMWQNLIKKVTKRRNTEIMENLFWPVGVQRIYCKGHF